MAKCDYYLSTENIQRIAAMEPKTDEQMDMKAIACELLEAQKELELLKKSYGHTDEPVFGPLAPGHWRGGFKR